MWWKEPLTILKGIGPKKAAVFNSVGINTLGDLLGYYPRQESYLDYSKLRIIGALAIDGSKQVFKAVVFRIRDGFSGRGKKFTVVTVRDATGYAELYFFMNQRYLTRRLKPEMEVLVIGRVRGGRNAKMVSEVYCQPFDAGSNLLGIVPVYALSGDLTQNMVREAVKQALLKAEEYLPETLPAAVLNKYTYLGRLAALKNIHFPASWDMLRQARERLIFEELFLLQCGLLYYRDNWHEKRVGVKHGADGELLRKVVDALPFELTQAQKNVWRDISSDMQDIKPMHRILQGDVGSGKTVISALALAKAAENGYQGCIMAPTEILAAQHYATFQEYLAPLGVRVALLTGALRAKARREILENLALGLIDVLVGTHALIQEDVKFKDLSLVVTDEQHRFGVGQRAKLTDKSRYAPDVLIMTATPIPRTLALTVYGDLDISLMKGRPPGRKQVVTLCYEQQRREEVYAGLVRQVQAGSQAYIVCPVIEDSEQLNVRSAENVFAELRATFLHDIPCALLHGKMKNQEKEAVMADFAAGNIKVLVSTTVIEVGVNVPNATLMIVENAERFGLAQLHQLRGRVGRGSKQSYCVLLAGADNPETLARLHVLHDSDDGFYLAEQDLKLRGAGQLFGLRQHGLPDLHIADILRDTDVIVKARQIAQQSFQDQAVRKEIEACLQMQFDERFTMIFNS